MPFDRDECIIGYGKRLSYSDTENGTYVEVFGTIDVTLPERELGKAEITNDDSPDYHKDYIPGLYEPGTVPFTYRYTATIFADLEDLFMLASDTGTRGQATKWWKCVLADGAEYKWRGFLMKNNLPTEIEGSPVVEAEIQVGGKMQTTPPA